MELNDFTYFYPEKPRLAQVNQALIDSLDSSPDWVAEPKYNGSRLQLHHMPTGEFQVWRKIPRFLTPLEQEKLLAPLQGSDHPVKVRNLALLRLMLDSGLRVSEALALQQCDLDLETGRLVVRNGKGSKDRGIWIGEETLSLVKRWARHQGRQGNGLIFTTRKGGKMSRHYVLALLYRLSKEAGLGKKAHPHMLRHTFATDLLRETKNLRLVQKALGHADLSTTQIYTHIVDDELESAMKGLRRGKNDSGRTGKNS
jgi:integrase/recombinase XerD